MTREEGKLPGHYGDNALVFFYLMVFYTVSPAIRISPEAGGTKMGLQAW